METDWQTERQTSRLFITLNLSIVTDRENIFHLRYQSLLCCALSQLHCVEWRRLYCAVTGGGGKRRCWRCTFLAPSFSVTSSLQCKAQAQGGCFP